MLFIHTKQFENKLDCKLKKQEIVFDTAVFHYELTFTNHGYVEYKKALEDHFLEINSREDNSLYCLQTSTATLVMTERDARMTRGSL